MGFAGLISGGVAPAVADQPMRAAVTPYWEYTPSDIRWVREDTKAQARIRTYDREGPGIVGAMLDIPHGLAAHVRLVVQKRNPDGSWERTDDPAANAILNLWRGDGCDQISLYQKLIRLLDGPGEAAQFIQQNKTTGQWEYRLLSTTNIMSSRTPGLVAIRTRPNAKPGSRWYKETQARFIQHYHFEDPEWPDEPWSKMHRVLPHVETYRRAMRTIGRNLDSQLAMNGILWAEATAKSGKNWIAAYMDWARKAVDNDTGPESVVAFPLQSVSKPEWIDVGRASHEDQLLVAEAAVKEIARASDLPTLMVTEGPGSANHWNDIAIADWVADFTMYPRNVAAVGMITQGHFRPWAKVLGLFADDPGKYRVWFDDSRIRGKTDNSSDVYRLQEQGVATREAAAEAAGLTPDQVLELPDGMSEYEHWLLTAAPGALQRRPEPVPQQSPGMPEPPPITAESRLLPALPPADWDQLTPQV